MGDTTEDILKKGGYSKRILELFYDIKDYLPKTEIEYEVQIIEFRQILTDSDGNTSLVEVTEDPKTIVDNFISKLLDDVIFTAQRAYSKELENTNPKDKLNNPLNEIFYQFWASRIVFLAEKELLHNKTILYPQLWRTQNKVITPGEIHSSIDKNDLDSQINAKILEHHENWIKNQIFKGEIVNEGNNYTICFELIKTSEIDKAKFYFEKDDHNNINITDKKVLLCHVDFEFKKYDQPEIVAELIQQRNQWKYIDGHFPIQDNRGPFTGRFASCVFFYGVTKNSNDRPFLGNPSDLQITILNADVHRCTMCNSLNHTKKDSDQKCFYCNTTGHKRRSCKTYKADKQLRNASLKKKVIE